MIKSDKLNLSFILPSKFTMKEMFNEYTNSYTIDINCKDNTIDDYSSVTISKDPDYTGWSTSGALCANAGPAQCHFVGKYFIPYTGSHITVVKDEYENQYRYRGIEYAYPLFNTSVLIFPGSDTKLYELLEILYSVNDQIL